MTSDDDPALEETEPMSDSKRNAIIVAAAAIFGALAFLVGGAL